MVESQIARANQIALAARTLFEKRLDYMMNGYLLYIEGILIKKLDLHDFSNLGDDAESLSRLCTVAQEQVFV